MATVASTKPATPFSTLDTPSSTTTHTTSLHQTSSIPVTVTFLGGLAPLFANSTTHTIQLPLAVSSLSHPLDISSQPKAPTVADLIKHLTQRFLSPEAGTPQSKRDMFVLPDNDRTIRPGILVLVNEADWELLGEGEAELEDGDEVVFVSTLHGG